MVSMKTMKFWQSSEPLKIWFDRNLFLYPEIFFTYAVESFKAASKMHVGYELFVGSAHPHSFTWYVLYGSALVTLITAILSDNFIGKYVTIIYGLIFFTLSCLLFTVAFTLETFLKMNISFIYIASFACLLVYVSTSGVRNVMLLEQVENWAHLRSAIFIMIFFRLVVRAVTSLDIQFRIMTSVLHWNAVVALVLSFVYLVLWIKDGRKYLLEQEESGVFFKCIKCVYFAAQHLLQKKPRPSEPLVAEHEAKLVQSAKSVKSVKSSKSVRYLEKTNWLYRSLPHSTQDTVEETIDLMNALPWVFPGIIMGNLIHYVLATSARQILLFGYDMPLNYAFIKLYTMIFEIFLFPIAFFLGYVRPFKWDLVPSMVGYIFVLVAAILMAVVQNHVDDIDSNYMPRPYTAHVRIVNLCPYVQIIEADWLGGAVNLSSYSVTRRVVSVDQPSEYKRIIYRAAQWTDYDIKVFEQRSVTHVFTKFGPHNREEPDPINDPDNKADVFFSLVLLEANTSYDITFELTNTKSNKVTTIKNALHSPPFKIDPGNYRIESRNETEFNGKIWTHVIDTNAALLSRSLGAIIAIYTRGGYGFSGGKYFMLERTMGFRYILLLQIIFACIGNSLASASFFKFLFYESPSKMRSTLLSLVIACDLVTVGFYSQVGGYLLSLMVTHVVIHLGLFLLFAILFLWRLSWNY